ncbi:MAG: peptidoglycan DD-metalloendopeptidase family protein [Gammaproteobacteria bacterium]|nr:peptidoglycan DD-metalloendopeptidase family protein [Gammaproteobacteria bacterium]
MTKQQLRRNFSILTLLLLAACTSSWKAPVSSYSEQPDTRKQQKLPVKINGRFYKVRPGDTLYSIAWRTGHDWQTLARWNNLKSPHQIFVGQIVRVVPPEKKVVVKTQVAKKKPVNKVVKPVLRSTEKKVAGKTKTKTSFKSKLYWRWPANGRLLKTYKRGDVTRKGIVVSGKAGQSILAAEDGKVVYSGSGLIGYGQLIIIKHNNKYLSAYGYNSKLLVKEGDWVTKGKKIALMGNNNNSKPALHFEIRRNGDPINPVAVLPKRK